MKPVRFGDLLPKRRTDIRPLAAPVIAKQGECPDHPGNDAGYCGPCAGDLKAADPAGRAKLQAQRAHRACDRRFPRRFRQAAADHPEVLAWLTEALNKPEDAPSLLLVGPTGTGKTWQAYGALRRLTTTHGGDWLAIREADLFSNLRPRPDLNTAAELKRYRQADLLLIDDIGTAKTSEWTEGITYDLIDDRWREARLSIFTTNVRPADLREILGDRIASRLSQICTVVVLDGPDRRRTA